METVLIIAQILVLLCLSTLSIYLITILGRMRSSLEQFETSWRQLSEKAAPVLENLEAITRKVKEISANIDGQVEMVRASIRSAKDIVDSVVVLEKRIQQEIEGPVMEGFSWAAAVYRGIKVFFEKLRE